MAEKTQPESTPETPRGIVNVPIIGTLTDPVVHVTKADLQELGD